MAGLQIVLIYNFAMLQFLFLLPYHYLCVLFTFVSIDIIIIKYVKYLRFLWFKNYLRAQINNATSANVTAIKWQVSDGGWRAQVPSTERRIAAACHYRCEKISGWRMAGDW